MVKKTLFALTAAAFFQAALAQGIEVSDAWARPTVEGMKQGGAFMTLKNTGKKDDALVGAEISKSLAARTELHTHINENGVMKMREVKDGIPVSAGETQELKPGGYHVMYFDLKKPFKAGDSFKVKLKFKSGQSKTVTVKVKDMKDTGATMHQHGQSEDAQHQHNHGSEGHQH